jgi:hypothetical protein
MSVSDETVRGILAALLRHVDAETAVRILSDLETVPGSGSFRSAVERLNTGAHAAVYRALRKEAAALSASAADSP